MEVAKTQMLGIPVLRMSGDVDHQTASYLGKAVRDVFNEDDRRLFFDLGDCPYLDSAGLSVLLTALREIRETGWIGVIGPNPNLVRLFEIVDLTGDPGFRVFPNCEQLVAASRET